MSVQMLKHRVPTGAHTHTHTNVTLSGKPSILRVHNLKSLSMAQCTSHSYLQTIGLNKKLPVCGVGVHGYPHVHVHIIADVMCTTSNRCLTHNNWEPNVGVSSFGSVKESSNKNLP